MQISFIYCYKHCKKTSVPSQIARSIQRQRDMNLLKQEKNCPLIKRQSFIVAQQIVPAQNSDRKITSWSFWRKKLWRGKTLLTIRFVPFSSKNLQKISNCACYVLQQLYKMGAAGHSGLKEIALKKSMKVTRFIVYLLLKVVDV